tara:strand:+ start:1012 stop:2043 length:1032 start_codon:yes stop_codon:yes gene_type:complete
MKKFLFLLLICLNIEAENSENAVLTCNDPVTNFRWSELCKSGFNVSFMVDYFQGKYNDSSYRDNRLCHYLSLRLSLPKYEDSGKTKEEFYEDLDEEIYLGLINQNEGMSDYFLHSFYTPFKIFNPTVTFEAFAEFIKEDNQRIADSNYQDNVSYKSVKYNKIADILGKKCLTIIRHSYSEFILNNSKKSYNKQIKIRESFNTIKPAFSKMDIKGKVEGLDFEVWITKANAKKIQVSEHKELWTDLLTSWVNVQVMSPDYNEDYGHMDQVISQFCISVFNTPVCPFVDASKHEFNQKTWNDINKRIISATSETNGRVLGRPVIEYVKHAYCVSEFQTTRCFEGH